MTTELALVAVVIATILFIGWWFPKRKQGHHIPSGLVSLLSLETSQPYLIFFWGKYCGHCKVMKPVIESLQSTNQQIKTVMVDDHGDLARQMGILGVPSLAIVSDLKLTTVKVGNRTKPQIESILTDYQIN